MRVTSEFFVSALVRRIFSAGDFAAVERKGAAEAGAVFLRQRYRDGLVTLYGPAPQSFFDEEDSGSRKFEIRAERVDPDQAAELIAREARFDPDLWLVELEVETVEGLIEIASETR